jgi:hypothetical protein
LVIVANAFGGYPTAPRLLTFLYPLLALVLAAGVQELALRIQGVRFAAATLVAILLAFPLLGGLKLFERSWAREDVRPLLAELAGLRRPGDIVYVYYGAQYAYAYYAGRFQLPLDEPLDRYVLPVGAPAARAAIPEHAEMTISIPARYQPDLYRVDLERLRGRSRVWVVMSHVWPQAHEGVLGAEMDRLGHRFYESNTPGAVLWGYDLTPDAL